MSPLLLLLPLLLLVSGSAANRCGERCGGLQIPFPFHLNASCGPPIAAFRLSCGGSYPYLADGLRVVDFLTSGSLLIDYSPNISSSTSSKRWYSDVNRSFPFVHSPFFAVTSRNVLRLYDCEDSSVCKSGCGNVGCCYPLSDGSVWRVGDGFDVFAEFGCRGFSSWAGGRVERRGMEIEWALPRGDREGVGCAEGAAVVNATAVEGGVRCVCGSGFVGDGFKEGAGCLKFEVLVQSKKPASACSSDGNATNSTDCCKGTLCKKKFAVLIGVLISVVILAAVITLYFLLCRPVNANNLDLDPACLPKILGKVCSMRLFTYQELHEATKKVEEDQKLAGIVSGSVQHGMLGDGTLMGIQNIRCETQDHLREVLEKVEHLSKISHHNIARIIGFCVGSDYSSLLVHEFFSSGTLQELLQRSRGSGLSWYYRINIASEIASALVYLQREISPPIFLHDLKSGDIFIDTDYSAKISSFKFLKPEPEYGSCSYSVPRDSHVVYNFGIILLELVIGSRHGKLPEAVLCKINDRKFHEIVDPYLGFSEQLPFQQEQIERVARFAVQCLSNNENGRTCMVGVVKEFIHIVKDTVSSSSRAEPALEATFSNSSLLQMISMSPDSMLVPCRPDASYSNVDNNLDRGNR